MASPPSACWIKPADVPRVAAAAGAPLWLPLYSATSHAWLLALSEVLPSSHQGPFTGALLGGVWRGIHPLRVLRILPCQMGEHHALLSQAPPLWDSCSHDLYGVYNLAHEERIEDSKKGAYLAYTNILQGPCQGSWRHEVEGGEEK